MAPNHRKMARDMQKKEAAEPAPPISAVVPVSPTPRWQHHTLSTARQIAADAGAALILALFVAFVLGSLSFAGVITMTAAIISLVLAWIVGIGASFLLPKVWDPSHKHRVVFATLLAAFLFAIGRYEFDYQAHAASVAAATIPTPKISGLPAQEAQSAPQSTPQPAHPPAPGCTISNNTFGEIDAEGSNPNSIGVYIGHGVCGNSFGRVHTSGPGPGVVMKDSASPSATNPPAAPQSVPAPPQLPRGR
jgi:hypothetical protein